ncbi:MAG: DUF1501 domain-containing protein [Planctomycetaceae bacterium]
MSSDNLLNVNLDSQGHITRRQLVQLAGTGFATLGGMSLLGTLGLNAAEVKRQRKACIFVYLNGAPSQLETWDPKPGTSNGGPTKGIKTSIPGVDFAEFWPQLAKSMKDVSVIRSMAGKEAAHERARYHLHTGRRLIGATKYPHFGALTAYKLGDPDSDVPNFISIGNTLSSGFLGVKVAPFVVDKAGSLPRDVTAGVPVSRTNRRLSLLEQQDEDFAQAGASAIAHEHRTLYSKAAQLMTSQRLRAFTFEGESDATKAAYGNNSFGQGCLVARRLVESGVPFVEVQRGGWDMHQELWQKMPSTAAEVDTGVAQLIADLKQRGLLDSTLVVCFGEFGRTPKINSRGPNVGRDHWARNFNLLMAGAGIKGGVCIGETSANGEEITRQPVSVDDFFQTMCQALGIDAGEELYTPDGRPLRIVDAGTPIKELIG